MRSLPAIGLGTWQNTDPVVCQASVRTALEMGYRHVDTAKHYGNEQHVGAGIHASSVPRDELVVATKVHPETFGLAHDDVIEGVEDSLNRMSLEYIDLLYVHWPVGNYDVEETLTAFDELRDRGAIKKIGVSNFSVELVEEAVQELDASLFAHQVEMHPLLHQDSLASQARSDGHYLVAYSPLARGDVFDIPEVCAVADKHGVSAAQVSLAWLLSKENVRVIPKASTAEHIHENLRATEISLDDNDIAKLDGITRIERYVEREGAPWQI